MRRKLRNTCRRGLPNSGSRTSFGKCEEISRARSGFFFFRRRITRSKFTEKTSVYFSRSMGQRSLINARASAAEANRRPLPLSSSRDARSYNLIFSGLISSTISIDSRPSANAFAAYLRTEENGTPSRFARRMAFAFTLESMLNTTCVVISIAYI